jgi:hypothetical protein
VPASVLSGADMSERTSNVHRPLISRCRNLTRSVPLARRAWVGLPPGTSSPTSNAVSERPVSGPRGDVEYCKCRDV